MMKFKLVILFLASECWSYVYRGDCVLAQARGTHGFQYCYATGYGYHGDEIKKICCKAYQNACYHIQSSKLCLLGIIWSIRKLDAYNFFLNLLYKAGEMGCFKMEKSKAKNNSDFFSHRTTNQTWKPGFFPTEQVGFLGSFSGIICIRRPDSKTTKTDTMI